MATDPTIETTETQPQAAGLDESVKPSLRELKKRNWTFAF